MIIDIIAIVLLAMAIFKGWRRGLIIAVFSIIAFIIGIAAAMKLSVVVAGYLEDSINISAQWMPVLSFAIVFIGVVLLIRLGANLLERTVEMALLGWVNKLGGIVLYVLLYLFAFSVLLFFAKQVQLIDENTISSSVFWPVLEPWGPWVLNTFSKLVPVFKDMFTDLEQFFSKIAQSSAH